MLTGLLSGRDININHLLLFEQIPELQELQRDVLE